MGISNETIRRRVEKVRQAMRQRGLKALVAYANPTTLMYSTITSGNVRYLTNWVDKISPSLLVLPLSEDPVLVVPGPFAKAAVVEKRGVWVRDIRAETDASAYGSVARRALQERGIPPGEVGLLGRKEMPVPVYQALTSDSPPWQFVDADDLLYQIRITKEPEEIELHRVAAKISDAMLFAVMNGARPPGKWAWQLMAEVEYVGRSQGAEIATLWLDTGPNPRYPGFELWENSRQIQEGDRVNAGTYVAYDGYWGHGLRMGVKGKASPELKRYFQAIRDVQEAGINALKPGKPLSDVDKAMKAVIDEHCPVSVEKDAFRFRPAHGLGLQYAEPLVTDAFPQPGAWSVASGPAKESKLKAQPGMVLELHPNFGVPGLGMVCMGDMALVTESGVELLTKFPRELYEI